MRHESLPDDFGWLVARMKEAELALPGHDYLSEPAEERKPTPLGNQLLDLEHHTRSFLAALEALRAQLAPAITHEESTAVRRSKGQPSNPMLLAMIDTATWRLADAEESIHFAMRFLLTRRDTRPIGAR